MGIQSTPWTSVAPELAVTKDPTGSGIHGIRPGTADSSTRRDSASAACLPGTTPTGGVIQVSPKLQTSPCRVKHHFVDSNAGRNSRTPQGTNPEKPTPACITSAGRQPPHGGHVDACHTTRPARRREGEAVDHTVEVGSGCSPRTGTGRSLLRSAGGALPSARRRADRYRPRHAPGQGCSEGADAAPR